MTLQFRLVFEAGFGDYQKAFNDLSVPVARAATGAMQDVRDLAIRYGRTSIAAGGFSRRWQNALRGKVYPERGFSLSPAAWIYHNIQYAIVFEEGAKISGSPLLWLPLPTAPAKIGGAKTTVQRYLQQIGPLKSISVPGRPPMLAGYQMGDGKTTISSLRAGSALARLGVRRRRSDIGGRRVKLVPLFFGVSSVTLRKRFDIAGATKKAFAQLGAFYLKRIALEARNN